MAAVFVEHRGEPEGGNTERNLDRETQIIRVEKQASEPEKRQDTEELRMELPRTSTLRDGESEALEGEGETAGKV